MQCYTVVPQVHKWSLPCSDCLGFSDFKAASTIYCISKQKSVRGLLGSTFGTKTAVIFHSTFFKVLNTINLLFFSVS